MMKPFKIIRKAEVFTKGRWQYKSNSDPFSKSEAPQWEFYSLEQNYLIEKAYYDQKNEVDIGDYLISIKHMIQKKKSNIIQQRPIRRINWEGGIQGEDRSTRYFETELPKTMNKVFGNLGDFLLFFSRRNPEILDFSIQFEKIEKSNDLDGLHKKIIPKVVCCLEELSKPFLEQLKNPLLSGPKKKVLKPYEELISLFKEETASFEEFYGKILKAYTMNTCLYEKLNNYLRNETWTEIDILLPYAFCLCKAFFNFNLQTDSSQNNKVIKTEHQKPRSILLYRGTAFDEGALCFYKDPQAGQKYFSWNCVTSASTNVEVAKKFMYDNVDLMSKKYPVLFMIEIPILEDYSESEYLKWIDIRQHSAKKEEDEVVLAPGSVFEVVKASTDEDQRTKIWLKMNNNIQFLSHGGLIMPGALQSKMMTEKEAKIISLEGEELLNTLKCLAGNKLIEQVEFCMCTFDKRSLAAMMGILSTLERTEELKLISCEYEDQDEISSGSLKQVKRCNISKVEISGSSGFDGMLNVQNEENVNWISLRELKIAFGGRENDSDDDGINDKIFQRFRHFNQLRSLTLDFIFSSIVLNPINICLIFSEIKYLIQLTSLTLDFREKIGITDEGVYSLAFYGLKHLIQLTSLTLNFDNCYKITDKGMKSLASEGLGNLIQLTSLTLNFSQCDKITDKGMKSLVSEGLGNLIQLTSLTLNFDNCEKITDKGMKSLVSEGLRNLIQLTSLDLNLYYCDKITDEGVSSLAFQGLQNLTQLTILTMKFGFCSKITDEGVLSLALQGLQNLTKLASLTLDFCCCKKITNEGVGSLACQGLRYLIQLKSLTLDFSYCKKITNEGVRSLASEGLRYLIQLKSLALNFTDCEGITDEDEIIDDVIVEVPKYLSKFEWNEQDLSRLYFYSSSNGERTQTQQTLQVSERNQLTFKRVLDKQKQLILEESFSTLAFKNFNADAQVRPCSYESPQKWHICLKKYLAETEFSLPLQTLSETLRVNSTLSLTNVSHHFSSLTSLTLDCSNYREITDEGMQSLASDGLQNLTQLTSLIIKFSYCNRVIDEGVQSLASKGLRHLTQLASLTIQFSTCSEITNEGVRSLASQGLQSLPKLTFLALDFWGCYKITDEGVQSLTTQGLQHLTQLTFLDLNFSSTKITDEGVQSLVSQGLRNLTQLISLALNFNCCDNITDKGVHILAFQGLKYMTQLSSLTLDFRYCSNITDFMFSNLSRVLHYLGFVAE